MFGCTLRQLFWGLQETTAYRRLVRHNRSGRCRFGGDMTACTYCQATELKLFRCARCGVVKYCGKECQRQHWKQRSLAGGPEHKAYCVPMAKVDEVSVQLMVQVQVM